jgi:hypothetical protein
MIHLKSGGFKIKKVDFDLLINRFTSGLRYFKTQDGFFRNIDHFFEEKEPIIMDWEENMELFTVLDWVENVIL